MMEWLRPWAGLTHGVKRILLWLMLVSILAAWLSPVLVRAQATNIPTRNTPISLVVLPGQPDQVLAGTLNAPDPVNVYHSTDGAVSWLPAGEGMTPNISIAGIAVDPNNPNLILAGDGGFGYMFRSRDGGKTWEELTAFKAMLAENAAVGELYSVIEDGVTVFYASTRYEGVFRTPNGGDIWQKLDAGLQGEARRVREVVLFKDNVLYAGTHAGLYRLLPNSSAWEFVPGLPSTMIVFSLWTLGDTIYAGTGQGLYSSPDGETWTPVPNFPQTIVYDIIDTGQRLVVATETGLWAGIGDAWQQPTVNGAPYGGVVYAVANTPKAPRTIYAATATDWVLRSDDEGVSFYPATAMPPLDVQAALATPTPTPTFTPTPTDTPTPTATPTDTPTPTPPPTATDTPVPTNTPIPTDTPTPTETPTETPLPTDTPVAVTADTDAVTTGEELPATGEGAASIEVDIPTPAPDITSDESASDESAIVTLDVPTPAPPTEIPTDTPLPTAVPTETPTETPLPTDTPAAVAAATEPMAEPVATQPAEPPAAGAAPVEPPTDTPMPTATQPPRATREPLDVGEMVYTSLPPVFVGAGVLLIFVILAAGLSVVRGPRDI